ncbi:MAG TPA: hypothetical protein VF702_11705 [Allosphingosinicella sp.]
MIEPFLALAAAQVGPAAGPGCTFDTAVPADVRQMAEEPARWLDRCVRIEGYVSYNRFYADVAGYYSYVASDYADRRNDGWLGLYPWRRYGFRGPMRRGSVVGIVHDCETDQERAEAETPGGFIMMTGFCHYRYGLVLRPAIFRPGAPADFVRQVGDEARLRFGDLQTESEVGPAPPEVRGLAARFVAAVAARDEQALNQLVSFSNEVGRPLDRRRLAARRAFLIGDGGSPLSVLRPGSTSLQSAFFRTRRPQDAASESPSYGWHACYCRTADCTGLWPISDADATADPTRPYLCIQMYSEHNPRLAPNKIAVTRAAPYPIEPERTAFRRQSDSFRR